MNITLLIHGVPMGFNTWKSDNSDYLKRFYRELDKNEKMTVEVISTESGPATFYNYLRYNTILDADGRAGSYFGMSLRIDGYECVKIADIFYLMQAVFNNHVIPAVFNVENSTFTYKSEDFTSLDGALSEIENNILRALLSFTNIDRDYAILPKSLPRVMDPCEINPEDLTDNDASLLIKGVRIIVSDDIATRKTKAYEDKIKELNQSLLEARSKADEEQKNYQDKIRELNQSLLLARSNVNGDQSEIIKKSSDNNAALRQEIDRLKMELSEYRSGGFNPTPHDPHGNDKPGNPNKIDLKRASIILNIVLALILLLMIPRSCNSTGDTIDDPEPDPKPYPKPEPEPYPEPDPKPQPFVNLDGYRLDVTGFKDGSHKFKIRLQDETKKTYRHVDEIPGINIKAEPLEINPSGIFNITDYSYELSKVWIKVWIEDDRGRVLLNRNLYITKGKLYNEHDQEIK